MEKFSYIVNIIVMMFVFASCKDEDVYVADENEPCYTLFVSNPNTSETRATYEDRGSEIAVKWEKGDVLVLRTFENNIEKTYNFYYRQSNGDIGEFYHYGTIPVKSNGKLDAVLSFGNATDGENSQEQFQKKNNECREYLTKSLNNIKLSDITLSNPVELSPASYSLLHIQVKSPAVFYGGSLLKITGLEKDYSIVLGDDPDIPFVKVSETLDVYVVVPCITDFVSAGTKLKLYFYAYDKDQQNAIDGDEYHYYITYSGNSNISTSKDKVLKITLPDRPTHAAIQLGLPSGTKWATTNVGAEKETDYGDYFAWGEIAPKTVFKNGNTSNYLLYNMADVDLMNEGILSPKVIPYDVSQVPYDTLVASYDAASQIWGDEWKMPSRTNLDELIAQTTRKGVTVNSVKGVSVTSKINSKSIFLPLAGYRDNVNSNNIINSTKQGHYWTSSPRNTNSRTESYKCSVSDKDISGYEASGRYKGFSIRPVRK